MLTCSAIGNRHGSWRLTKRSSVRSAAVGCQRSVKTSHFKEGETAPLDCAETGSMEDVECPQSEPANNDIQSAGSRMVAATHSAGTGNRSRNGQPIFPVVKTGHFDHRR